MVSQGVSGTWLKINRNHDKDTGYGMVSVPLPTGKLLNQHIVIQIKQGLKKSLVLYYKEC